MFFLNLLLIVIMITVASRRMALQLLDSGQYRLKDIALIGLIVAVCIWAVNSILKRWRTEPEVARLSTPDLEKKPSGSKFKKSDRKPGGMHCPRLKVPNVLSFLILANQSRMDTLRLQKANSIAVSELGCSCDQA